MNRTPGYSLNSIAAKHKNDPEYKKRVEEEKMFEAVAFNRHKRSSDMYNRTKKNGTRKKGYGKVWIN